LASADNDNVCTVGAGFGQKTIGRSTESQQVGGRRSVYFHALKRRNAQVEAVPFDLSGSPVVRSTRKPIGGTYPVS